MRFGWTRTQAHGTSRVTVAVVFTLALVVCLALADGVASASGGTAAGEKASGTGASTGNTAGAGKTMPKGHLKPFGQQGKDLGPVSEVEGFLAPRTFFKRYIRKQKPVIFRQAVTHWPMSSMWKNDSYLLEKYGEVQVTFEVAKKENRSLNAQKGLLKDFLARYDKAGEELYVLGEELPGAAYPEEVGVPSSLFCDIFLDQLHTRHMWFSSGGTRSVLHQDTLENILCVFDGVKKLVMMPPSYVEEAYCKEGKPYGTSPIDVDAVDLERYPLFSKVQTNTAELHAGDCLYIPYGWWHQVNSYGRNIGLNYWFMTMESDPEGMPPPSCGGEPFHLWKMKYMQGMDLECPLLRKAYRKFVNSKRSFADEREVLDAFLEAVRREGFAKPYNTDMAPVTKVLTDAEVASFAKAREAREQGLVMSSASEGEDGPGEDYDEMSIYPGGDKVKEEEIEVQATATEGQQAGAKDARSQQGRQEGHGGWDEEFGVQTQEQDEDGSSSDSSSDDELEKLPPLGGGHGEEDEFDKEEEGTKGHSVLEELEKKIRMYAGMNSEDDEKLGMRLFEADSDGPADGKKKPGLDSESDSEDTGDDEEAGVDDDEADDKKKEKEGKGNEGSEAKEQKVEANA